MNKWELQALKLSPEGHRPDYCEMLRLGFRASNETKMLSFHT